MKTVFISNYINHHQIPFSDALYEKLGEDYHFIQTEPMEEERVRMGWAVDAKKIPYVILAYEEEERCRQLIEEADLVLAGWTLRTDLFEKRLGSGKLTLRISERIYREGQWKFLSPRGLIAKYKEHIRYRNKPVYLLCAGAYVASDFSLIHAYPGKMFRFGYFPKTRYTDMKALWAKKSAGEELHLVWAGRMIALKHPEFVVRAAAALKARGYRFVVHMVGSGNQEETLRQQIAAAGLEENFKMYGFLEPEAVRDLMEGCHIHLFTSNYLEGWGAVINEAMNAGCCVLANAQTGAAPYLIKDGENGCLYQDGSYEAFEEKLLALFEDRQAVRLMGENAYRTVTELWNAEHAAAECIRFYKNWEKGIMDLPAKGPFSKAAKIPAKFSYNEGKLE